jgi:hypothetical protein
MELRNIALLATIAFLSCSSMRNGVSPSNDSSESVIIVEEDEDEKYTIARSEQFFVANQDGYMYYEDGGIMQSLYLKKYSTQYPDYRSFKTAVLNNNVTPPLPKGMSRDGIVFDTDSRFLIDTVVMNDFKNFSIDRFIHKYSHKDEYGRLRFNDKYQDTQRTEAYCLWLTGKYIYIEDDISGEKYIKEDSTYNALYSFQHQNEQGNGNLDIEIKDDSDEIDESDIELLEQFFIPNQDGYMYYENGLFMKELYQNKYSEFYPNYHSFKDAILNDITTPPFPKGMSIDGELATEKRFLIDPVVMSDYKSNPVEAFIEKYCHNTENKRLIINNEYPDTKCTVAYCLWLTGNYILYRQFNTIYIDKDSTLNAFYNYRQHNRH